MTCGIYKITNISNGKMYVGSSIHIERRWMCHKSYLSRHIHYNLHLQYSWNKYGESCFVFDIIEECKFDILDMKEEYWIEELKTWDREYGYNKNRYINGRKLVSSSTKEKIRLSHTGVKLSEEHKKKISKAHLGMQRPQSTGDKIGKALRGKPKSEKAKQNMSKNHADFSGENCGNAKLTWEKVAQIRKEYSPDNCPSRSLAKKYGVNKSTILSIIKNKTWKILRS